MSDAIVKGRVTSGLSIAANAFGPISIDTQGDQLVGVVPIGASDLATLSATPYSAPGGTTNVGVIKASAGRLFGLSWYTSQDATLMIFDKAIQPVDGDTPVYRFPVVIAAGEPLSRRGQIGPELFPGTAGIYFGIGIAWGWSSTNTTLTRAVLATDALLNAAYK